MLEHGHLLWGFLFDRGWFSFGFAFGLHARGLLDNHGNFLEVGANGVFQAGLVQTGGRVIHSDTDTSINSAGAAMNHADFLAAEELRHRVAAKRDDYVRVDGGYLAVEVVVARPNFARLRVAVIGRATLHHVGDKHIRTFEVDTCKQFIEKMPGWPNKRTALSIFIEAGTFDDE